MVLKLRRDLITKIQSKTIDQHLCKERAGTMSADGLYYYSVVMSGPGTSILTGLM